MDPSTLMSASSRGSSTERLTAACAARWMTASGVSAPEDVDQRRGPDVRDVEPRGRVDVLAAAGAEVVDDRHLVARLDAAIDHVGADEAGAARHEDLHAAELWGRCRSGKTLVRGLGKPPGLRANVGAMTAREAATDSEPVGGLGRLFAPRSIALVGVPGRPLAPGGPPAALPPAPRLSGSSVPGQPSARRVIGDLPAYPDLDALPEVPDVAWIGVPAAQVGRRDPPVRPGGRPVRGGARRRLRRDGRVGSGGAGAPGRERAPGGVRLLGTEHGGLRQRVGSRRAHLLDRRQAGRASPRGGGAALAVGRRRRLPPRPRRRSWARGGPVRLDRQRGGSLAGRLPRVAGRGRARARGGLSRGAGPGPRADGRRRRSAPRRGASRSWHSRSAPPRPARARRARTPAPWPGAATPGGHGPTRPA